MPFVSGQKSQEQLRTREESVSLRIQSDNPLPQNESWKNKLGISCMRSESFAQVEISACPSDPLERPR